MGTEPWRVVWRSGRRFVSEWSDGAVAYVEFTHEGERRTLSCGACTPAEATQRCAAVYARATSLVKPRPLSAGQMRLSELLPRWVLSNADVAAPETVTTFEVYSRTFLDAFDSLLAMTETGRVRAYARERLRAAVASTVRRELSGLRSFIGWCVDEKMLSGPPAWVSLKSSQLLPKKAAGTRVGMQRAEANPLAPAQVIALLAALPVSSEEDGGYVVRARLAFAYATGLRPATIDKMLWTDLVAGEDGEPALKIRDEIDKSNYGRMVPLSAAALAALKRTPRTSLLVFGRHDYRPQLEDASAAAGLPFTVAPYDLRHARATHWIEEGMPLGEVAFLLGHRLITTTNKYVHPSGRSARSWLNATTLTPTGADGEFTAAGEWRFFEKEPTDG